MLTRLASALARFIEPLRPVDKPAATLKPDEESGGGHGNPPAEPWSNSKEKGDSSASQDRTPKEEPADTAAPGPSSFRRFQAGETNSENARDPRSPLRLQAGLTQVILEIQHEQKLQGSSQGVQSYESGTREQKTSTRLPKGSMLDKKAG